MKKRLVLDAVVAKEVVVVALVEVEFSAVKFWRVEEPVAVMFAAVREPVRVRFAPFPVVKAKVVAKNEVEVAFVEVEFCAVKFWRVDEPVTRRLLVVARPLAEIENWVVVPAPLFAKSPKRGSPAFVDVAYMESLTSGDEVPIPVLPKLSIVNNGVVPVMFPFPIWNGSLSIPSFVANRHIQ